MDMNKITAMGLSKFPSAQLQQLKYLKLSRNPIGSKGAQLLIKADMPALKELHAWKC